MPCQSELERCPLCGGNGPTVETRKTTKGQRRRRHQCQKCQHRWSTWGVLPLSEVPLSHRKPKKRALNDDQLREVLVTRSKVPAGVLAKEWGISPWPIWQARSGQGYTDRLPELARGSGCLTCVNWRSYGCGMGFPEAHLEGPGFAAECSAFATA